VGFLLRLGAILRAVFNKHAYSWAGESLTLPIPSRKGSRATAVTQSLKSPVCTLAHSYIWLRTDKRIDKHPSGGAWGLLFLWESAQPRGRDNFQKNFQGQKENDEHLRFYGHRTMNLALDSEPARKGSEYGGQSWLMKNLEPR
jgi:hypothetical protein